MLHLTKTTIATILSLYRRHKIRNVRAIHAILSLLNPSLAAYPNDTDASSFETEHLQDLMPPHQYNKIVASAGHTRKYRDRVPSDKEKVIEVLNQGKCRDYVDAVLTGEEVGMLRRMGVKTLGRFEGRDSLVEANRAGNQDTEARNEVLGHETANKKVEVILNESSPIGGQMGHGEVGLLTPGREKGAVLVEGFPDREDSDEELGLQTPGTDIEVIVIDSSPSEGLQLRSNSRKSRVAHLRSEE